MAPELHPASEHIALVKTRGKGRSAPGPPATQVVPSRKRKGS
ncbi:hypothetical protein SAMN04490239_1422 [Rhodococcus koreensis]|jgi:hypothetical protein|uniref:Uncharacterized protein n=1 Tax=Rhodococcus koreensis TaxID=99653 RepID=A0A1H4LR67_9NOCA|nr:hypothetical protein SAMN04490239_1422 [Rhodococcus koreensis]